MTESTSVETSSSCWCGNSVLDAFNAEYDHCKVCGTLVLKQKFSAGDLAVKNDDVDFYGKNYWLGHQSSDLDQPDIFERERKDLSERNLHWLETLLKFKSPPAKVMELGCAHGSFVALMNQAGFAASGCEMSPWVVDRARRTFGINVFQGTFEELNVPERSLDAIAMMDVMEHLPDPISTLSTCLSALHDDGMLLIQMPEFKEERTYAELVAEQSPFLTQLKADEHLFLFSRRAAIEFFRRLEAIHISFEDAIFAHYDMFLVVSRQPLARHSTQEIETSLERSSASRVVRALMDVQKVASRVPMLESAVAEGNKRAADLYVENDALKHLGNLLAAERDDARKQFSAVEADRVERGDVIEAQGLEISQLQEEVHLRLTELASLYESRNAALADMNRALAASREAVANKSLELEAVVAQMAEVEADRAERLEVIKSQGEALARLERAMAECQASLSNKSLELEDVVAQIAGIEADRAARLQVIESQGEALAEVNRTLSESRADLCNKSLELEAVIAQMAEVEADRTARLRVIESQGEILAEQERTLTKYRADLSDKSSQLDAAVAHIAGIEADRAAQLVLVREQRAAIEGLRGVSEDQAAQIHAMAMAHDAVSARFWWRLGKSLRLL